MPKLLILNAGPDTAGVGINLKRAFDKHALGWETRSVSRDVVYLGYPSDIVWPYHERGAINQQVIDLVREADVVHVMDNVEALSLVRGALHGQTVIVHHLGTAFRRNERRASARARYYNATEVTDSLDLIRPHVAFLPATADLEAIAARRPGRSSGHTVHLAHAPTNRAVKSTAKIVEAVEHLARHYPIDFDLIERVNNAECLARKARADIFVDQLLLGFGMNAVECWAMGIPVVSGLADPDARSRAFSMWGTLPWADATAATLVPVLEHLISDRMWRGELGERGRRHAQVWHSESEVVSRTLEVYQQAGAQVAA